jgi:hypothetical protein
MKKILIFLAIIFLVQAACSLPTAQNAAQTALPDTAIPAASTAAPDFTAKLFPGAAELYAGPGENYPKGGVATGDVTITGQAYGCSWFNVVSSIGNKTGWLRADQITYTVACTDVPAAEIPPTPQPTATYTLSPSATFTLIPTATDTLVPTSKPGVVLPPSNSCNAASSMTIGNRTGAYADFKLVGPGIFYVSLAPDVNTQVSVCEGCYDVYIINGACGDASGSMVFRLCDGFNGWIYCG